jgi:type II secretory pathway pseudopilin PulG
VELLVVVSIIALLIAILMPSLKGARDQARHVKCMANLHAIGLGLRAYAVDNRGWIPDYETIGRHGFRIAPRRRTDPSAPEESWGLQVALEAGTGPQVLLSGLAYPLPLDKPMYLPGDSDVWICPSNPGLKDHEEEWRRWGNTYAYRCTSATYNLDRLASGKGQWKNPLVWDNYKTLPGESGFIGPFKGPGYRVASGDERAPHSWSGPKRGGPSQYWIANYADGHCAMNAFNKN